jgi:hypothetical protein
MVTLAERRSFIRSCVLLGSGLMLSAAPAILHAAGVAVAGCVIDKASNVQSVAARKQSRTPSFGRRR